MADRGVRHFKLTNDHIGSLQYGIKTTDQRGCQRTIGASDNDDCVLAVIVDHDQRHATGAFHRADRLTIDLFRQQGSTQRFAVGIAAHATDHRDLSPQSCRGHGLVCALSTGNRGKRFADQGFTATRQPWRPGDQVHVQAAYYHYVC
ncbi:hypothetical protein D3C81_1525730 [compost metagenome]